MMNKIKILIVEDELIIAEDLKDILEGLGYEVCGIAISAREALIFLEEKAPDLALLDIQIKGGRDGIALAEEINEQFHIPFIMLTSHADSKTLTRVKEVHPYGYLVKPFQEKEIRATIEIALANFSKENDKSAKKVDINEFVLNDSLFVRTNGMLVKLKLSEITYLEADANYTNVYTQHKKFVIRAILKELEQKLDERFFVRIHKSYMINLSAIEALESHAVHISGKEIPISRNQYSWLINKVNTF
jgi:DNA-binding LytR/AlgR family response regulator